MFSVQLVGKDALVARLDAMPASVRAILRTRVKALAIMLQGYIVSRKLHGQVLHQRTGALARSIQELSPIEENGGVYGKVFSAGDIKYAAVHEYGGTIPAHDIYPVKAEALAFMIGGRQVFASVVHHPGSHMPERSFMRSSLAENAAQISRELKSAVIQGLQKGAAT